MVSGRWRGRIANSLRLYHLSLSSVAKAKYVRRIPARDGHGPEVGTCPATRSRRADSGSAPRTGAGGTSGAGPATRHRATVCPRTATTFGGSGARAGGLPSETRRYAGKHRRYPGILRALVASMIRLPAHQDLVPGGTARTVTSELEHVRRLL